MRLFYTMELIEQNFFHKEKNDVFTIGCIANFLEN